MVNCYVFSLFFVIFLDCSLNIANYMMKFKAGRKTTCQSVLKIISALGSEIIKHQFGENIIQENCICLI